MELKSYFEKFLREIRPTDTQKDECKTGHTTLRERLYGDDSLKSIIVSTFLQGSYRRATAIRPKGDKRSDVDVVVVTNLNKNEYSSPDKAMDLFIPFLKKHYIQKYEKQGRSIGIELSYVDLDLVITSAPSEAETEILKSAAVTTFDTLDDVEDWRLVKSWVPLAERETVDAEIRIQAARKENEWKTSPLWIPDREAHIWEPTHPLEQIRWTSGKNARCNKHYVNVVRAIKWWQRVHHEDDRPSGYPLEHIIGLTCPDGIKSIGEGVTLTLEAIVLNYSAYAAECKTPFLPDHGVDSHNVFARITDNQFSKFYGHVQYASKIAREALDVQTVGLSATKWRELFGDKFPPAGDDDNSKEEEPKGPFTARSQTGDMTPRKYG